MGTAFRLWHRAAPDVAGGMAIAVLVENGVAGLAFGALFHQSNICLAIAGVGVDSGVLVRVLVLVEFDVNFSTRGRDVPCCCVGGEVDVAVSVFIGNGRSRGEHFVGCCIRGQGGGHGEEEWEDGEEGLHCDHVEDRLKMSIVW